jgi:hypothetical protein
MTVKVLECVGYWQPRSRCVQIPVFTFAGLRWPNWQRHGREKERSGAQRKLEMGSEENYQRKHSNQHFWCAIDGNPKLDLGGPRAAFANSSGLARAMLPVSWGPADGDTAVPLSLGHERFSILSLKLLSRVGGAQSVSAKSRST